MENSGLVNDGGGEKGCIRGLDLSFLFAFFGKPTAANLSRLLGNSNRIVGHNNVRALEKLSKLYHLLRGMLHFKNLGIGQHGNHQVGLFVVDFYHYRFDVLPWTTGLFTNPGDEDSRIPGIKRDVTHFSRPGRIRLRSTWLFLPDKGLAGPQAWEAFR